MTALDIRRPILVGNSCGGGILHTLGADHSDRVGGLMYLDAAEDPTLTQADYEQVPVDMANLAKRVPQPTPPVVFPEAEQRLSCPSGRSSPRSARLSSRRTTSDRSTPASACRSWPFIERRRRRRR
jgi:pimeloyl-ACP methyl ester carboxylesterase